jgi:hypothetical protein
MQLRSLAWLLLVSCNAAPGSAPGRVPYACTRNSDCSVGTCNEEFGFCTQTWERSVSLLLEITPQASDPIYGGARFVGIVDRFGFSDAPLAFDVPPRVRVSGSIKSQVCARPNTSTLAATIRFSPQERLWGVPLPDYELHTELTIGNVDYSFAGAIPQGNYDIYVLPDSVGHGDAECGLVPLLYRNQTVGTSLNLDLPVPDKLNLRLPWRTGLERWTVDLIHPLTGDRLSTRTELVGPKDEENSVSVTLSYSPARGPDFIETGAELVRLSPPPGEVAPNVLLERGALELLSPGQGVISGAPEFGERVDVEAWIWARGKTELGAAGSARFTAVELSELLPGLFATFETVADFDPSGLLSAKLYPGQYRVQLFPSPESGLAGFEHLLRVWPEAIRGQAGQVLEAPAGARLRGTLSTNDGALTVPGIQIQAQAALRATTENQFRARPRHALTGSAGDFALEPMDCGECREESGALVDVSVRPDPSTGLPWATLHDVAVFGERELPAIVLPPPLAQRMRLTFGRSPLSGALVRAYVVVDRDHVPIADPLRLPFCRPRLDERCSLTAVQVAETRSDSSGEVLLLLAPGIQ